jgi:hypothetical protein
VFFEPGEDHRHGAAPNRFMTHLAMQQVDEQGNASRGLFPSQAHGSWSAWTKTSAQLPLNSRRTISATSRAPPRGSLCRELGTPNIWSEGPISEQETGSQVESLKRTPR